ncbi:MAG: hypothetical protein R3B57_13685 [Phycisphaerales bacterium]
MPTLLPILLATLAWASPPTPPPSSTPPRPIASILLADFDHPTHVVVSWKTREGEDVSIEGDRSYSDDKGRTLLGRNVECFVAVGGTRLTKGAGHPDGVIVRVGFYKHDATRLFFDDIAEDGRVHIQLSGIHFNHPVGARPDAVLQHLKFAKEQLEVCSLPTNAKDQYNTAGPTETLNGRITPGIDTRQGVLDGSSPEHGSVSITTADDGSLTLDCEFPYTLLRHLQDPWQSGVPGTFAEPIHFHVELEALPLETLHRLESGEESWPPPSRQLDDTPDQVPPDAQPVKSDNGDS